MLIYTIYSMFEIYESTSTRRSLKKLPIEVLRRYEKWKDIVKLSGIKGLRLIKWFHDEALKGKWKGYRSSRLGIQFRVIYLANKKEVYVEVFDITAHDYRKK